MTEFDPKWPHGHTTRDGKEARIYALDGAGSYPIHGAIKVGEKWEGRQWQINGSWRMGSCADATDLINAPEKTEWWTLVFADGSGCGEKYTSEKAARAALRLPSGAILKLVSVDGKPVSAEIVEV